MTGSRNGTNEGQVSAPGASLVVLAVLLASCAALTGCATGNRASKGQSQKSWGGAQPPISAAISSILETGRSMRVTVALGCSVTFSADYDRQVNVDRAEWTKSCIAENQALLEGALLKEFSGKWNFELIERPALGKLHEQLFSLQASEMTDNTRLRLWKLTNASHIVIVNIVRSARTVTWTSRLVEIDSGRLLASQSQRASVSP